MKPKKNRMKTVRFRCTEEELTHILNYAQNYHSISDYIRSRIFARGSSVLNPIELIRALDEVCLEMKRIGNNINQFAKYTNQRRCITDDAVIKQFENELISYVIMQKKLEKTYRKIINL